MKTIRTEVFPHPFYRYGVAVATVAASTGLMFVLRPYLERGVVALPLAAVVASAFYGGLGPGLAATLLGVLASDYFFMEPQYSLRVHSADDIAEIAVFSAVAVLINVLSTASSRAKKALQDINEKLELRVKERTAWLALVYDITGAANDTVTVEQAYRFVMKRVSEEMDWKFILLYSPSKHSAGELRPALSQFDEKDDQLRSLRDHFERVAVRAGEGPVGRVWASGAVKVVPDIRTEPGYAPAAGAGMKSAVIFPVLVDRVTVAVVECFSKETVQSGHHLIDLVRAVGLDLGLIVHRKRLQEDYAEAIWKQQKETAQEFHDDIGQRLTGLGLLGRSLTEKLRSTPHMNVASRLSQGIDEALQQMRELVRGVFPVALDSAGLMAAISEMATTISADTGIPCRFECPREVLIEDNRVAMHLYRIVQEAVTNALRHARPGHVRIALEDTPSEVRLEIWDDGRGMPDPADRKEGSGLRIMRYRAAAIAARLYITTGEGRGTLVQCHVPKAERASPSEKLP
jgi:signal transduction histidine kinase